MLPSPGLPSFDYVRPASPQEVTRLLLRQNGAARLFMGGTDVFVRMRDGALSPRLLIDLKGLPGMTDVRYGKRLGLHFGAAVDMNTLAHHPAVAEHFPLLAEALNSVASYQLRTRATMGGNLCNGSPAADTAPAALVMEANLFLYRRGREICVPVSRFFLGPGKTAVRPGDYLQRIEIPPLPAHAVGHYYKLGRNAHGDLAIVGAAVLAYPDSRAGSGYGFRIALASVAPTPIRVPQAESILRAGPLSAEVIEAAASAAMEASRPIDDVRSSAAYRRAMVKVLVQRGINAARRELSGV